PVSVSAAATVLLSWSPPPHRLGLNIVTPPTTMAIPTATTTHPATRRQTMVPPPSVLTLGRAHAPYRCYGPYARLAIGGAGRRRGRCGGPRSCLRHQPKGAHRSDIQGRRGGAGVAV